MESKAPRNNAPVKTLLWVYEGDAMFEKIYMKGVPFWIYSSHVLHKLFTVYFTNVWLKR